MTFRIVANPDFRVVTPDQKMDFNLVAPSDVQRDEVSQIRWACINDPSEESRAERAFYTGDRVAGPIGSWSWTGADWDYIGHHRITCSFTYNGSRHTVDRPVHVVTISEMAIDAPPLSDNPRNPDVVLATKRREYAAIRDIERARPGPASGREAYEQRMTKKQEYNDHLQELLEPSHGRFRYPISAHYYSPHNQTPRVGNSQWLDLRVFLTRNSDNYWAVVDWTNPSSTHTSGNYDGIVLDRYTTPTEALQAWDSNNSYPLGVVRLRYRSDDQRLPNRIYADEGLQRDRGVATGHQTEFEFETDGRSTLDHFTAFLDWIAIGGAVIAGVVTLVAPVPGSRVASMAIWSGLFTSIAAGTASSALRIAGRAEDRRSNWRDDGLDTLSIAANLLAVGVLVRGAGSAASASASWARGATVTSNALLSTRNILIASFTADMIQGVIVGAQQVRQLQRIANDPNSQPDERFLRMATAVAELAASGVLLAVNVRATRADLNAMGQNNRHLPPELNPEERLRRELQDPDAVVDLDRPPRSEGNTSEGRHRARVETGPAARRRPDSETVRRTGDVTLPHRRANRASERPYRRPPEVYTARPGEPLPPLDPAKSPYLWAVDPDGVIHVAPERQQGAFPHRAGGRADIVKHRDLLHTPEGQPAPARAGGEFSWDSDQRLWIMDNNSSLTFARADGQFLGEDNLAACMRLLEQTGTDTSNFVRYIRPQHRPPR